jgi:hypothetical protein
MNIYIKVDERTKEIDYNSRRNERKAYLTRHHIYIAEQQNEMNESER